MNIKILALTALIGTTIHADTYCHRISDKITVCTNSETGKTNTIYRVSKDRYVDSDGDGIYYDDDHYDNDNYGNNNDKEDSDE